MEKEEAQCDDRVEEDLEHGWCGRWTRNGMKTEMKSSNKKTKKRRIERRARTLESKKTKMTRIKKDQEGV